MSNSPANKLLRPLIIFTIALLAFQLFSGKEKQNNAGQDVDLILKKEQIAMGKIVEVEIRNNLQSAITLPEFCPKNPLNIERYENGEWKMISAETSEKNCKKDPVKIEGGEVYKLSFAAWNSQIFNQLGRYRISLNLEVDGKEKIYDREMEIKEASALRKIWEEGLYKPILNILLFLISVLPGKNLGVAVILLTLLIKLILLWPNHKALASQKQMQKLQPQLEALKLKYKDNPQALAQETMAIYKKYKVNPVGSCLPMLIQLPILIALFYVVRDGLVGINPEFLYGNVKNLDLNTVDTFFLGLELTKINWIILPVLVGGLQFLQMKMTLAKTTHTELKKKSDETENPMAMMNKTMLYIMPVMVAIFTATVPAAVGIYWGTSTLFGIGQQWVVNKSNN